MGIVINLRTLPHEAERDYDTTGLVESFKRVKPCTYDLIATDEVERQPGLIAQDMADDPDLKVHVKPMGGDEGLSGVCYESVFCRA